MDAMERPLHTLETGEVDTYIDHAIDRLFVPKEKGEQAGAPPEGDVAPAVADAAAPDAHGGETGGVVEPLQEALLSLDWEISERNISVFEERVQELAARVPGDKHVAAVAQMAAGVCKYLSTLGETASPLGVQFPGAAVRTIETLLSEPPPSASQRRKAVEELLERYRRLQSEVRRRRASESSQPEPESTATETPQTVDSDQTESLAADEHAKEPVAIETTTDERQNAAQAEEVEELSPEVVEARPDLEGTADTEDIEELEPLEELEPMEPEPVDEGPVGLPPLGATEEASSMDASDLDETGDESATLVVETPEHVEVDQTERTDSDWAVFERNEVESGDDLDRAEDEAPELSTATEWDKAEEDETSDQYSSALPPFVAAEQSTAPPEVTPEQDAKVVAADDDGEPPMGQERSVAELQAELSAIRETLNGLIAAVGRVEAQLTRIPARRG